MKKYYFTFIFASVFICSQLNAQFKYGPRLGLGITSLGGGNSGIGYQAGIFINAELKDRIGIQAEVLISAKNGNYKFVQDNATGTPMNYERKYNFSYVDIPIYVFFPISEHITCLFGPQFSTVNKAEERLIGPDVVGAAAEKQTIGGATTNMGIAFGLDINTSSPIRFGLRFATTGGGAFSGKSSFVGATMAYYMDW